jgi:hypothetical protein
MHEPYRLRGLLSGLTLFSLLLVAACAVPSAPAPGGAAGEPATTETFQEPASAAGSSRVIVAQLVDLDTTVSAASPSPSRLVRAVTSTMSP